jgi:putrescine transport system ATP-binding protein
MSLADNIASSMRFAGLSKASITERTAELLDLVDIAALARRRPHEVSGGQRQRTGLARAIAATPKLLLLDEPFSAIDVASRARVRARIVKHIAESGASCVIATHDPNDLEATDAASIVLS